MSSKFSSFSRRGPDNVTEELVVVLSGPKSYEFKALFLVVHAALKARNMAGGGEEMLRLRSYEKLQNLVQHGQVKKTGKQYKGVRKPILLLAESLKSLRENGPVFTPRPSQGLPEKIAAPVPKITPAPKARRVVKKTSAAGSA
jgi:hypothetical protein